MSYIIDVSNSTSSGVKPTTLTTLTTPITPIMPTTHTPTLYLFIINARHLSIRRDKIKMVVKQIADLYKYRIIPKFINTNDPVDIEPKLASMNDRFSYTPCGIEEYDKLIEVLNIET